MKKTNLFLTMLFALIVLNAGAVYGGTSQGAGSNTNWQLKKEESGVKFYVMIDSCAGGSQQYYKLRIENTNTNAVKVNYSLVPMDLPASAPVHGVVNNLPAGASVETNCADANDKMKVVMLPPATTISDLILLSHVE